MKKERGEDREIRRAREEEAWRSSRSGKLGVASSRCNFNIDMSDWLMPGCLERAGKIIERRRERLAEDADVAVEGDRRSYECNTSVAYTGSLQSNAKDRVKLGEILLNGRRRCRGGETETMGSTMYHVAVAVAVQLHTSNRRLSSVCIKNLRITFASLGIST